MAVTSRPHDQITQCLQALSETQRYIQQQEQDLQREKAEFDIIMTRKKLELKSKEDVHEQRVKMAKEDLKKEIDSFEETKRVGQNAVATTRQVITIDVGGEKFYTDIRTLEKQQQSLFPILIENIDRHSSRSTYIFIDRDSKHFRFILNYMRQGEEVIHGSVLCKKDKFELDEMISEARYYRLNGLIKLLQRHKIPLVQSRPITFKDLHNEKYFMTGGNLLLKRYETTRELRFEKKHMTAIVFENVHFRHFVSFEGSILNNAKFVQCQFDQVISFVDADISHVCFDNCVNAMSDRLILDGTLAKKVGVAFIPSVDWSHFTVNGYYTQ